MKNGYPIRRNGCCGNCDGFGVDPSAPETGGRCWDCRGTGHAHTGRCRSRFLDWFHLNELDTLGALLAWAWVGTFLLITFIPDSWMEVAIQMLAYPLLAGFPIWCVCSKLADRQIRRYGLPPANGPR